MQHTQPCSMAAAVSKQGRAVHAGLLVCDVDLGLRQLASDADSHQPLDLLLVQPQTQQICQLRRRCLCIHALHQYPHTRQLSHPCPSARIPGVMSPPLMQPRSRSACPAPYLFKFTRPRGPWLMMALPTPRATASRTPSRSPCLR
eukprot:Colp12_sorted_trinity150504_noHs@27215